MATDDPNNDRAGASPAPTRRTIRLPGYDYALAGWYALTICVEGKRHLFGSISEGAPILSELGQVVTEEWINLPVRYPHLELDEFVVMPNHLHVIIGLIRSGHEPVSRIVGAYKSLCFHRWRKTLQKRTSSTQAAFWQRNYYEHIIRDSADLDRCRQYIRENPNRWK